MRLKFNVGDLVVPNTVWGQTTIYKDRDFFTHYLIRDEERMKLPTCELCLVVEVAGEVGFTARGEENDLIRVYSSSTGFTGWAPTPYFKKADIGT